MPLMIYCTAALTSFSDIVSYIIFLFSEWRITVDSKKIPAYHTRVFVNRDEKVY